MTTNSSTKGTAMKLGVITLAIMNVAAVVSLRGLPAEAVYGLSSAFYYLFAAIVFLVPTALVAAELAAMFAQKEGGVFRPEPLEENFSLFPSYIFNSSHLQSSDTRSLSP